MRVESNQRKQKEKHDLKSRERNFEVDDVFVRNYHHGYKCLPGVIDWSCFLPSETYHSKTRHCHKGQVRKCTIEIPRDSYNYCEPDVPDIVIPSSETSVPSPTITNPLILVLLLTVQLLSLA